MGLTLLVELAESCKGNQLVNQDNILHNIYMYIYIYIYIYIIQGDIFFVKSVIFEILRIFNGLLPRKSVKKYILTE